MTYGYALRNGTSLVQRSDGAVLPSDPDNTDWQAYQAWLAAGNTPAPAPSLAPVVPQVISDRQFFQQLAAQRVISEDEALAAVQTGTIPSEMQPLVTALPEAEQFGAKMMLSGATQYDRANAIVAAIGQAYGWTSAQLDAVWVAASTL